MDKLTRKLSAGTVNRKKNSFKLEHPQGLGSIDRVQTLQSRGDPALSFDNLNEQGYQEKGQDTTTGYIVANTEFELPADGFDEKSFFSSEKNQ